AFQSGLAMSETELHFSQLPLPINELLTETRRCQAMVLARSMNRQLLLTNVACFRMHPGAHGVEVFLTLPGISVQFGEMSAKLLGDMDQSFQRCLGGELQLGPFVEK